MTVLEGRALNLPFRLRVPDESQARQVASVLVGLLSPLESHVPVRVLELGRDANEFTNLLSDLTYSAIAAAEGNLLLHAGAVAKLDGGTAVLCGPSGSGKSTLTTRLTRAGYHYVTDETVCAHPVTLRITPFRRPVSLKPGSPTALARDWGSIERRALRSGRCWFVSPDDLGGADAPEHPLWPAVFVFPTFATGATCAIERLTDAETAFLLGQNSSRLRHIQEGPLETLSRAARRAPGFRVRYGTVDHGAAAVAELLGDL